mgnify:FL=1
MKLPASTFLTDSLSILGGLAFASVIVFWFLGDQPVVYQFLASLYFLIAFIEQYTQHLIIKQRLTKLWHGFISPVSLFLLLSLATLTDPVSEQLLGWQILGLVIVRLISIVTRQLYNKSVLVLYSIVFIGAAALATFLPVPLVLASNPTAFIPFLQLGTFAIWLQAGVTIYKFLEIRNTTERSYLESREENAFYHKLFSLISHNLRNSLSLVISRVDLLRLLARQDDHFQQISTHLDPIESSTLEAFRLVSAVLKRNTTDEEIQERIALHQVVEKVVNEYSADIRLQLRGTTSLEISQRERLAFDLCFDVFLSNSLKYGASQVSFTLHENAITIKDDGPGVDAQRLATLGVRKVVSSSSSGTGNGLFLSKQLLGLLGWTIDLQSELGAGMTIHLHRLEA